jgi:hypothetical protein
MPPETNDISFQPVRVRVEGQAAGLLVFVGGALVAVLVKLDETHDDLEGQWYAEAAFNGLERMTEETFNSLQEVSDWIQERL